MNKLALKSVLLVVLSNIVKLFGSIIVSFVIPRLLGIMDYGFYKIFALYSTYFALTHLGFVDGIYLKYGGKKISDLKENDFRSYFKFFLLLQFTLLICGTTLSLFAISSDRKLIFLLLFINTFFININNYFQILSQMTSRFKEFTTRTMFQTVLTLIAVFIVYYLKITDYYVYVSLIISVNLIIFIWYIYTYRQLIFGHKTAFFEIKHDIFKLFVLGLPLMLSNIASTFVLATDKQIVEIFFSLEIFSVYSFAYSMLAMITVMVSAISVVLFPVLKKSEETIPSNYSRLNAIVISLVCIGLVGYFPLVFIIHKFLPQYILSVKILRIALPGLLLSSSITAIKHNFFKVKNKNIDFLLISILCIIISVILNLLAYFLFKDVVYIAISSVIGMIFWYLILELYLVKNFHVSWLRNALMIFIGLIGFYSITSIQYFYLSFALYFVFSFTTVIIFNKNNVKSVLGLYKRIKPKG
ncbi:MAG: oligosaccharide flippase family protein [Acholeplasmataceae bacterium]